MRNALYFGVMALALVGCASEPLEEYYADRVDPSLTGFTVSSEEGNIGGKTTVIQGSGFGDTDAGVVVLLGHHNAQVVSVTDSEITIVTPPGPITGGPVDLLVATSKGYAELEDAYSYDRTVVLGGADPYNDQSAYILAQNLWTSCYGGLYDNSAVPDCGDFAWFGEAGLTGDAEFFNFAYPRVHAPSMGFVTGSDMSPNTWHFSDNYVSAYPSGIDELRYRVGEFTLENPLFKGSTLDVDLACDTRATKPADCDDLDPTAYDKGVMHFCESQDAAEGGTYAYSADWPVRHDFFAAKENGQTDPFSATDIVLNAPEVGLEGVTLTIPGSVKFTAKSGFEDPDVWTVAGMDACMDGDGDGQALLDEAGIVLNWEPVPSDVSLGGEEITAHTYVVASVSMLHFGWFGGEGWKLRSSMMVEDTHGFDATTGLSQLEIPNSVLYQFPSPNLQWSGTTGVGSAAHGYLGTWESDAGYIFIEVYRVTDYALTTSEGKQVLFSYLTGDMALPDWNHPITENDGCGDCIDNDGDGWTDALDPDCADDGEAEVGFSTAYTCNDGLDNNGDDLIDRDDPLCTSGADGETTCSDGVDNDADGWKDNLDPDCYAGGVFTATLNEDSTAALTACTDGVDGDGDGWIDREDPGCTSGLIDDEGGFSAEHPCNDGVDNDSDLLIDGLDPYCFVNGAFAATENKSLTGQCNDGLDNEATPDGYVDGEDPDCDVGIREGYADWSAASYPVIPTCYDGLDNDGDGAPDSLDPDCADGFQAED